MLTALWVMAVICMLVGTVGTVVPILPGAPLVFIGILLAAWINDFTLIGWVPLVACGILTVVSVVVDFIATMLGAKRVGASKLAIAGALLGTIVGIFFGLLGIIIGPFLGALIGELLARNDFGQAGKVGLGTWLGLVVGTVAKLAVIFVMLGIFVWALLV